MSLHCGPRWPAFLGQNTQPPAGRKNLGLGSTCLTDRVCTPTSGWCSRPSRAPTLDYRQRGRSAGVSASVGTRSSRFPASTAQKHGRPNGGWESHHISAVRLSFDPGGLTAAGARDRAVLASPSRSCGCGAQSQCAQGHPPRFTSERPGHARGAGLLLERSGTQAAFLPPLC